MAGVVCEEHGATGRAWVCTHLLRGSGLGFEQGGQEPDDARPDAWCDECERYRVEFDGWSEEVRSPAGIAAVCDECYDRIKARNELVRDDSESAAV